MRSWTLLSDGGLSLRVGESAIPAARRWIPRLIGGGEGESGADREEEAVIDLAAATHPLPRVDGTPPLLQLASVDAWQRPDSRVVELRGADAHAGGTVDLGAGRARLQVPVAGISSASELEAFTLLTVSAALLLSGQHRALLHAAAVVDEGGGAWLLVGDAYAGKTTTTLNLLRSGWRFLSDDHVVISRDAGGATVRVEGWPRTFHVDEGWERGEVTGRRIDLDPAGLDSGAWVRSAPLRGLYFPRVSARAPTSRDPLSPASALTRLIRQTPWFVADPLTAAPGLALLSQVCMLPAWELRLGLDSYGDPARLAAVVDAD